MSPPHRIVTRRKRIIYKAYIKLGVLNVQRCKNKNLELNKVENSITPVINYNRTKVNNVL
jgi:hypothetical protein